MNQKRGSLSLSAGCYFNASLWFVVCVWCFYQTAVQLSVGGSSAKESGFYLVTELQPLTIN